jgi:hypothetical protein
MTASALDAMAPLRRTIDDRALALAKEWAMRDAALAGRGATSR